MYGKKEDTYRAYIKPVSPGLSILLVVFNFKYCTYINFVDDF